MKRIAGSGALVACLLLMVSLNTAVYGWNPWKTVTRFFVSDEGSAWLQMSNQPHPDPSTRALTPPPPDHPGHNYEEASPPEPNKERSQPNFHVTGTIPMSVELDTVADAAHRAPFPLRYPSWLPEETELLWIMYQPHDRAESQAEIRMRIGGPAGKNLYLTQRGPVQQFAQGASFDADEVRVREVDVNGVEATLIEFQRDHSASIDWFAEGVLYSLRSDWDGDTTLKIAQSMQVVR